jgi:hypothetical protein
MYKLYSAGDRTEPCYDPCHITTVIQGPDTRLSRGEGIDNMEQKIVVEYAQSGTMIQKEVISFAIHLSYNQVPNINV